jgi:K+-sensing histidine kinase KdpD
MLCCECIFLVDLVILIILARSFARRSWKQRDDARNEWIAAVSHDVRTPLSIVVTDASNLETSPRLNEEEHARVERMVSKSQEMAALLADLNTANRLRYAMEPWMHSTCTWQRVVRRAIADIWMTRQDTYGLSLR